MTILGTLFTEARNGAANLTELIRGRGLRLGVTGLSRAGKTVFITALTRQLALLGRTGKQRPARLPRGGRRPRAQRKAGAAARRQRAAFRL